MSTLAIPFLGFVAATIFYLPYASAGFGSGGWGIAHVVLFLFSLYAGGCCAIIKFGLARRLRALHALNAKTSGGAGA